LKIQVLPIRRGDPRITQRKDRADQSITQGRTK
jgi:hypothetical protein